MKTLTDQQHNLFGWKMRLMQLNEDMATLVNDKEKMEEMIKSIEEKVDTEIEGSKNTDKGDKE